MSAAVANLAVTTDTAAAQTSKATGSLNIVAGRDYHIRVTTRGGTLGALASDLAMVWSGGAGELTLAHVSRTSHANSGSVTITAFVGRALASATGTLTVTRGGTDDWGTIAIVPSEITGADDTGAVAGCVEQVSTLASGFTSGETLTSSFGVAMAAGNAAVGSMAANGVADDRVTPRNGYSELEDAGVGALSYASSWRADTDTAIGGTFTGSGSAHLAVGWEIKAATGLSGGVLAALMSED